MMDRGTVRNVSDSSSVFSKQDQDGTAVPPWSCSQAVSKFLWRIPLLCVQWKTPDDGQRNCLKYFGPFLCPSSGVFYCTHHSGICHTGLLTACEKYEDGAAVTSWSCSQAVRKPVWHIPLLCVQCKTPDDGQRNCLKHVEFNSRIKFWEIGASGWFYYKKFITMHGHMNVIKKY